MGVWHLIMSGAVSIAVVLVEPNGLWGIARRFCSRRLHPGPTCARRIERPEYQGIDYALGRFNQSVKRSGGACFTLARASGRGAKPRSGVEARLVIGEWAPTLHDAILIQNIAKVRRTFEATTQGSTFEELAEAENFAVRRILQVNDLAFIAPISSRRSSVASNRAGGLPSSFGRKPIADGRNGLTCCHSDEWPEMNDHPDHSEIRNHR